jgi:hypothetical protein
MAKLSEFVKAIFSHESPPIPSRAIWPMKFGPMEANPWRIKSTSRVFLGAEQPQPVPAFGRDLIA